MGAAMRFMAILLIAVGLIANVLTSEALAWTVQKVQGAVTLKSGSSPKRPAGSATVLKAGDSLETGADGKAMLQDGESEIWLGQGSRFVVRKLTNDDQSLMGRLELLQGKLRAKFKRPSGPQEYPYEVKTKSVVAGVRGTEFFVSVEGGEEKVCTLEGLVRVTSVKSAAESWDVPAGRGLFVKPNEMPKVRETAADQAKKWVDATSF